MHSYSHCLLGITWWSHPCLPRLTNSTSSGERCPSTLHSETQAEMQPELLGMCCCYVHIDPLPQVALTAIIFSAMCQAATDHSGDTIACATVVATALSAVANYYGHEPETYKQAMSCEEKAQWSQACDKEIEGLYSPGTGQLQCFQSPCVLREPISS